MTSSGNTGAQQTQRMSSLEIAELTGKQHKSVMQAIRNMEPAREKVNGLKFKLVEYLDQKGERRPCYQLTNETGTRYLFHIICNVETYLSLLF